MIIKNPIEISVVIPCYNAEDFIEETIESVLSQTYKPLEIIVVNDGSTDRTADILKKYQRYIRIIHQPNQGECVARNTGLEAARGFWVAFLDADDMWLPQKLERQIEIIKRYKEKNIICIHTGFYLLYPDGTKILAERCNKPSGIFEYSLKDLILEPQVNSSTCLIKRDSPVRFPSNITQGGDMLFFAELSQYGCFYFISEPLVLYRQHPAQVTKKTDAWVVHFKNRFAWVDKNRKRLGNDYAEEIKKALRDQVVYWLKLAKWNRQWERYYLLKEYALTLEWPEGIPRELRYNPLPPVIYTLKDYIDNILIRIKQCMKKKFP